MRLFAPIRTVTRLLDRAWLWLAGGEPPVTAEDLDMLRRERVARDVFACAQLEESLLSSGTYQHPEDRLWAPDVTGGLLELARRSCPPPPRQR